MTTKVFETPHYAKEFHARLRKNRHERFVITVEDLSHMPRMSSVSSVLGKKAMQGFAERIVGVYKGIEDLRWQDIAEAIDAVDDFVPKEFRVPA